MVYITAQSVVDYTSVNELWSII